MPALHNFRDLPFTWKAVNGAPWSCVAEDTEYHFPSFKCFPPEKSMGIENHE